MGWGIHKNPPATKNNWKKKWSRDRHILCPAPIDKFRDSEDFAKMAFCQAQLAPAGLLLYFIYPLTQPPTPVSIYSRSAPDKMSYSYVEEFPPPPLKNPTWYPTKLEIRLLMSSLLIVFLGSVKRPWLRTWQQKSFKKFKLNFCCRMNQVLVYLLIGVCAGARITSSPEVNTVTYNPGRECLPYDGSVVPDCSGKTTWTFCKIYLDKFSML